MKKARDKYSVASSDVADTRFSSLKGWESDWKTDLVRVFSFDTMIGNNDRHHENRADPQRC